MRKTVLSLAAACMTVLSACNKSQENGDGVIEPVCGEGTRISNMVQCLGCASEDAKAIYFSTLDGDNLTLVREDRKSGDRLVLDKIPVPGEGQDFCFQFICSEDDYVYYIPYDMSDSEGLRTDRLWRVRKDGTGKEPVPGISGDIYKYFISGDQIYYCTYGDYGMFSCDTDGNGIVHLTDMDMSHTILYKDRFYYTYFTTFPEIVLASCAMDGTDEKILHRGEKSLKFVTGDDDNIYMVNYTGTGFNVSSVRNDGTGFTTILENAPQFNYLNFHNGELFLSTSAGNGTYGPGLYKYSQGQLTAIAGEAVLNFNILDGNRIIYMNGSDTSCGNSGASYETDTDGSYSRKL